MSAYPFDPAEPTKFAPGSEEKIAVLTARRELRLPLFLPGDVEGARQLNDIEPSPARRSPLERRIHEAITDKPVPSRVLAVQIACKLGHNFRRP